MEQAKQGNVSPPLPIPEGLAWRSIEEMPVTEGEWRKVERYACRECNEPAYINPYTDIIWGCKKCGYTTLAAFYGFFESVFIERM